MVRMTLEDGRVIVMRFSATLLAEMFMHHVLSRGHIIQGQRVVRSKLVRLVH